MYKLFPASVGDRKSLNTYFSNINSNLAELTRLKPRTTTLTTDAPTITYSTSQPTVVRKFPPLSDVCTVVGGGISTFDTTNSRWNMAGNFGFCGVEFCTTPCTVISLAWVCNSATKEEFLFFIDGHPVSLTPAVPTVTTVAGAVYYVTLTFSTSASRRIEILATGIKTVSSIYTDHATALSPAPKRRRIHLVCDSFSATTGAITKYSDTIGAIIAKKYDCSVSVDAIGGTGYISTGGLYTFGDPVRVARTGYADPDDIVFFGGINDDGNLQASVREAAYNCFAAHMEASPRSTIHVFGAQPSNNISTISADRTGVNLGIAQACVDLGITFHDLIGYPESGLVSWANGITLNANEDFEYNGSVYTHASSVSRTTSPSYLPGTTPYYKLKTGILYGTGKVGSTTGNGSRDTMLYSDGVHPTVVGASAWADYIAGRI